MNKRIVSIIFAVFFVTFLFLGLFSCIPKKGVDRLEISDADDLATKSADLRPYLSDVKHQGARNTCSVFAATALMEFLIRSELDIPIDLSEQYNYWASRKYTLNAHNDYIRDTYKEIDGLAGYLAVDAYKYGSMLESEWEYESHNWMQTGNEKCKYIDEKPVMECFTGSLPEDAEILPYRIRPVFIEREDIGRYIIEHQKPVVFNILWYMEAVDHTTGRISMPDESQIEAGGDGHVILLVGYDGDKREFVFRNSWGDEWGDDGYGIIPEEYILKHYEASIFEPISSYDEEVQELLKYASKGAAGDLIIKNDNSLQE